MSSLVNVRDHIGLVVDSDWGPAFAAAIAAAVADGRRGVFVPADAVEYTVRKPAQRAPSIDLRGLTNFTLLGEGDGSRIRFLGSGLGGSWSMILIGGDCVDVTVRNLYLDGDREHLTELDKGQHTHTIQVGGSIAGGFAHRVRIIDCTMTDMDGDGVAIAPLAGPFGGGEEVSVVDIVGCKFLDCHRSGVSNQRSAEFVRIHDCLFEGTNDQDIDFEPTGDELASGPRRYSILRNTIIHKSDAASVTLSGVGGDIPARDNVFAHNFIYGGRIGMVNTKNVLIFANYVESGLNHTEPVLRVIGNADGVRVSHNQFVRIPGAVPGKTLDVSSRGTSKAVVNVDPAADTLTVTAHGRETGTGPVRLTTSGTPPTGLGTSINYWLVRVDDDTLKLAASKANALAGLTVDFMDEGAGRHKVALVDCPRGVDVTQNRLHSHSGTDVDGCTVLVTNGEDCSFTDNEVSSFLGGTVASGVRFITSSARRAAVEGWTISNNRVRGDAGNGGAYANGITVSPVGVAVSGITVSGNAFRGCSNRIRWNIGSGGSYADIPMAQGNSGAGSDFADLGNVAAVCIGGNPGSQADYIYQADGAPSFAASNGSTARRRTGGSAGATIYFREAGA